MGNEEEKVIISRSKLDELEKSRNMLKRQLEEERNKFKKSAKYCIKKPVDIVVIGYVISTDEIYSNSDVVKELSDKNDKLSEEIKELKAEVDKCKWFFNMPLLKRVFYAIRKKREYSLCLIEQRAYGRPRNPPGSQK